MAKMMPGRVRTEGIALYEAGAVVFEEMTKRGLRAMVRGEEVHYARDDQEVTCSCQDFLRLGYCVHLAAVEYYLKNDPTGKSWAQELEKGRDLVTERTNSFGSRFLDELVLNEDDQVRYRLSASGQLSPYSSEFWWTLRINRLPDDRSYIVRDIPAFLTLVRQEGHYQIGKNYYEPLSLLSFDQASQDLIAFLWRLLPDRDRGDTYSLMPNYGRHLSLPSGFFEEGLSLLSALHDFSFEGAGQTFAQLRVKDLEPEDQIYQFELVVHPSSLELIIQEGEGQLIFEERYRYHKDTLYRLSRKQERMAKAIKTLPLDQDFAKHLFFDLEDQTKLAASLLDFKLLGPVKAPKTFAVRDFQPHFYLDRLDNGAITLRLTLDYQGLLVSSRQEQQELPFASHFKREERLFRILSEEGFARDFVSRRPALTVGDAYDFYTRTIPRLETLGQVHLSQNLEEARVWAQPQLTVGLSGGLLDIAFDTSSLDQAEIDLAMEALYHNRPYYLNKKGTLVVFDEETNRVAQALSQLRDRSLQAGRIQLNALAAHQLSGLLADQEGVSFSQEFERLAYDLTHPEEFEVGQVQIKVPLRDYQWRGLAWLSMLDHHGLGGILADDMGLGKTLQTIAFLTSKVQTGSRVLILAPSSLIYNWLDEFRKFTEGLDVAVVYGSKEERQAILSQQHQLVITSYHSFRQDFDHYQAEVFDYLILDEAQVIKNTETKIAQSLRDFQVGRCFALSGTPIENKLLEIWSIFQIVLPGLLPGKKAFSKWSAQEVAKQIKPFVLRRRKEEVLQELPDLTEKIYTNELAQDQKHLYLAQLQQMRGRFLTGDDQTLNRQKIEILSGITRLRQICDSPKLFMDFEGDSGKLDSLRQLLIQLKENGNRPLIFSQFRGMLDLVADQLADLGLSAFSLTGSTPADQRQEMTRAFNQGSRDAFLISLKAGGVGLNLTGADTVILIDLWWNPAVEMQAISRAHRLGQTHPVQVYRLITRGTIEEKILELQESKKNLVTTVLDGNETRASLSLDDIREILGLEKSQPN